jgi:hypothetical protein
MRETCHASPKKCLPHKMVQSLKLQYRTAIDAIRSTGSGANGDGEHVDDRAWREFALLRKDDQDLQIRRNDSREKAIALFGDSAMVSKATVLTAGGAKSYAPATAVGIGPGSDGVARKTMLDEDREEERGHESNVRDYEDGEDVHEYALSGDNIGKEAENSVRPSSCLDARRDDDSDDSMEASADAKDGLHVNTPRPSSIPKTGARGRKRLLSLAARSAEQRNEDELRLLRKVTKGSAREEEGASQQHWSAKRRQSTGGASAGRKSLPSAVRVDETDSRSRIAGYLDGRDQVARASLGLDEKRFEQKVKDAEDKKQRLNNAALKIASTPGLTDREKYLFLCNNGSHDLAEKLYPDER